MQIRSDIELSIVIPAYNESSRIASTLLDIKKFIIESGIKCEVIVVSDGSTDDTAEKVAIISETFPQIKLIQYKENKGKGFAVKTGVLSAIGENVLFMDADNATNIREYIRYKSLIDRGNQIVIGSRFLPSSETTHTRQIYRTFASKFGSFITRSVLKLPYKDTQCGFKLFDGDIVHEIFSKQTISRYGFDIEILAIARLLNISVTEVPISWTDSKETKIRFFIDNPRTVLEILIIKWNLWRRIYS